MWQRADALFTKGHRLDEIDRKQFVERFLRAQLKTTGIYCDEVRGGRVKVRVVDSDICREVRLRQYDLALALAQEVDTTLNELIVIQS